MLIVSTSLNHISVVNILNRLIQDNSEYMLDMLDLILRRSFPYQYSATNFRVKLMATKSMVSRGLIESAQILLKELRVEEIMRYAKSCDEIRYFLQSFIFMELPELCLEFLKSHRMENKYNADELIDLKLLLARFMVTKGYIEHAKIIVGEIDPRLVVKQKHFESLIVLNINIGHYKEVLHISRIIKRKNHIYPNYYTHLAICHLCFGSTRKASAIIHKQKQATNVSLHWKARLMNLQNKHYEAIRIIGVLENDFNRLKPVEKCFGYIEKGNTLRALSQYDEALSNYQKAQQSDIGTVFWLWLAHFEHAVTLTYLNENNDALRSASKGLKIRSVRYNSAYNPCGVLRKILLIQQNASLGTEDSLAKFADNALLWPFPYFPHKFWMLLLVAYGAIRQSDKGLLNKVLAILYKGHKNYRPLETINITKTQSNIQFEFKKNFEHIKSVLFPNDFFWKLYEGLYYDVF